MDQKVIWATSALEDLETAAEYIHRDSPAYAAAFVSRTLQTARSLSDFPERGRRIPEIADPWPSRFINCMVRKDAYVNCRYIAIT